MYLHFLLLFLDMVLTPPGNLQSFWSSASAFVRTLAMKYPLKSQSDVVRLPNTPHHLIIYNVRLAHIDPELASRLWTVECYLDKVTRVIPYKEGTPPSSNLHSWIELDAKGSLMLPSLCHSHIHLDKCFILDRCQLETGDFAEALKLTAVSKAKFRFNKDDLLYRGRRLITESLDCGVTSMRAHVEVDGYVGNACLDVACWLKEEFKDLCDIQISVFAQEPLFDKPGDPDPGENYDLLVQAMGRAGVEVVSSAPYVEPTIEQAKKNIALILELAGRNRYHVDFHLDYNLNPQSEPLIYEVNDITRKLGHYWLQEGLPERRITIGHATRLMLFTDVQWQDLLRSLHGLPVSFVGLPNSDLYMQGREYAHQPLGVPRGTLNVPQLAANYGLQVAMSVNNVENAFTPQGSPDPLALCNLGAAIFQSATPKDIRTLIRSVTLTSKRAIGDSLPEGIGLFPSKGDPSNFVILHNTKTLQQAALNPSYDRTTIKNGVIVARRQTMHWAGHQTAGTPLVSISLDSEHTRDSLWWYGRLWW